MGKIFVLIALARFMSETEGQFGVKALALSCEPERAVMHFSEFGDCEAYHIAPENQLNAVQERPFWTPVHRWWVLDFDAPHSYPLVMYEGAAPSVSPSIADGRRLDGSDAPQKTPEFDWTAPRKEVLRVMVKYAAASLEMSLGELAKEAGVGKSTVSAVKAAVEADRGLLNGKGKLILQRDDHA